jgi:hypothetical protein
MTVREERDAFAWEPGFEQLPSALLEQNGLVFVHDLKDDERLRHRILGELREEIGTVAEDGTAPKRWWKLKWRPSRAPVRVSVFDAAGARVVSFTRPRVGAKRFEIADGSGRVLGELVMERFRWRPALVDAVGQPVATVTRRKHAGTLVFTVHDRAGLAIGSIRDSSADALDGVARWLQRLRAPREHTLELGGAVSGDVRLMLLALVAGLYLVFLTPPAEQSGD